MFLLLDLGIGKTKDILLVRIPKQPQSPDPRLEDGPVAPWRAGYILVCSPRINILLYTLRAIGKDSARSYELGVLFSEGWH